MRQIAQLARGGSEGGSCLLQYNGTLRDIVIQDLHCLLGESLKDCMNLGFILQSGEVNIRPSRQKLPLFHRKVAKIMQSQYN